MALEPGGTLKNKKYIPFPKIKKDPPMDDVLDIQKNVNEPEEDGMGDKLPKKNRSGIVKTLMPKTKY